MSLEFTSIFFFSPLMFLDPFIFLIDTGRNLSLLGFKISMLCNIFSPHFHFLLYFKVATSFYLYFSLPGRAKFQRDVPEKIIIKDK